MRGIKKVGDIMRDIEEEIKQKLLEIEAKESVKILLAVESGSRAWKVESTDSDYDVRFVYIRKTEEYLRINPVKDHIDWQLDEVFDINGWDVKKVLANVYKSNTTPFEWGKSQKIYIKDPLWDKIYENFAPYYNKKNAIYHYLGVAKSTYTKFLQGDKVKYKKYFYALRPLLTCRYIEEKNEVPPIEFDRLLDTDIKDELRQAIDRLLMIKKDTKESDLNPQIPLILEFIKSEIEYHSEILKHIESKSNVDITVLDKVFLDSLAVTF